MSILYNETLEFNAYQIEIKTNRTENVEKDRIRANKFQIFNFFFYFFLYFYDSARPNRTLVIRAPFGSTE